MVVVVVKDLQLVTLQLLVRGPSPSSYQAHNILIGKKYKLYKCQ